MSTQIHPGESIDGFVIEDCLHEGGTGYLYRVQPPPGRVTGFPLLMKVPGVGPGEPTIGVESFEIEHTILPRLSGPHVPQVVGSGDDAMRPYLVMEEIEGESLAAIIARGRRTPADVARIGAALADAVHSIHRQNVIHFDLKPENVILRPDGQAVLIDFGFARHAQYPDLLAEGNAFASGSAPYVSPEQLQRIRTDPRSDVYALGVILYELATGEPPFGVPETFAGMRDRLWRIPPPPRSLVPDFPAWLQEVIFHCLERRAERRYASAAHVAFDLRHPDQVAITKRGERATAPGLLLQLGRWWRLQGARPKPRIAATQAPVILVAVDTEHFDDERHHALQEAAGTLIASNADYRLMLVSAIGAAPLGEGERLEDTASGKHLEHRNRLRQWVMPLRLASTRTSLHVIESGNPAGTILDLARTNHVDLIVIGAPAPESRTFAWWRSVASGVTADASCSVYVVRVPDRENGKEENA
jgi:nucleotide-binding universal stress UspA family protein